jgi:hypothetical protein
VAKVEVAERKGRKQMMLIFRKSKEGVDIFLKV